MKVEVNLCEYQKWDKLAQGDVEKTLIYNKNSAHAPK